MRRLAFWRPKRLIRLSKDVLAVCNQVDVATVQTDVFQFAVRQGRQGVACRAGVIPCGQSAKQGGESGADTAEQAVEP